MRLRDVLNRLRMKVDKNGAPVKEPRSKPEPRMVRVYNVDDMRSKVNEKKPFFAMVSGGFYGVMKKGGFYRMDKDRRPVKVRKAARRAARINPAEPTA